jgi:hypothetical protein
MKPYAKRLKLMGQGAQMELFDEKAEVENLVTVSL